MNDASCNCTDPNPFPVEQPTISLNNWVEIIRIETSCDSNRNQFELIPYSNNTIRSTMCKYNITGNTHTCYQVTGIQTDKFKIKPISYQDQLIKKTIYFFVNNRIQQNRLILETRLFDYYRSKFGTVRMGSVYFPEPLMRFPFQAPSRYSPPFR